MRQHICIAFLAVLLLGGCAFFQQRAEDYRVGRDTPYAAGETTIDDQTRTLVNALSGIPYVNFAAPFLLILAPPFLRMIRGHRIRKREGAPDDPKEPTPINRGLSILSGLRSYLFDVGPDGSKLKRGWKVALLTYVGALVAPHIGSDVIPFLNAHWPEFLKGFGLSFVTGLLAAFEKGFRQPQPA